MPTDLPTSLRDGRYVVVGLIAEGAQGATLDAVDKLAGRPVAVKRFQVKGARSWKDVELAEREASVLSRLEHPHLPAYLDHFEEGGALYLVMEKIEGQSLAALQAEQGTLPRAEVVAFLHDAADVLGYLHGLDPPVIHRDIKPGNVIRRPDGSFVLVDFGSVRARLAPKGGSTVVGTFGYMAPEQLQGRAMPATDVYGVGATAITLLTGIEPEELPHQGLSIDVGAALGPGADPALAKALGAMLRPDPDERAASLAPLLASLPRGPRNESRAEPRRRPTGAPGQAGKAAGSDSPATEGSATTAQPQATRLVSPPRPSPWSVPALAGFLVVLAVTLLRVGVALTTRVAVPLVLVMLSILFGRSMIRAAADVRRAGQRAGQRLKSWQGNLTGPPAERTARSAPPPASPAPAAPPSKDAPARKRARFEAPSAVAGPSRRERSRRRDRGAPSSPDDARGAETRRRIDPSGAAPSSSPDLRGAIEEIEDAVAEIDREVRRRGR